MALEPECPNLDRASCHSALTHDTWAMARAADNGAVSIQLSHGAVFPVGESAVRAEHLQSTVLLPEGRSSARLQLQPGQAQATYLPLTTTVKEATWALAAITLQASKIELAAADVDVYLAELGEPEGLRAAWQVSGHWRERVRKHAKALVRLSQGRAAAGAMDAGMPLEFVPLQDPTTLRPGQPLDFRLEYRDQPLPHHRVGIVYANSHGDLWAQTDANGIGRFVLAHPGWVLLRSVRIGPSAQPDLDWESDFATLVFELPHPELSETAGLGD